MGPAPSDLAAGAQPPKLDPPLLPELRSPTAVAETTQSSPAGLKLDGRRDSSDQSIASGPDAAGGGGQPPNRDAEAASSPQADSARRSKDVSGADDAAGALRDAAQAEEEVKLSRLASAEKKVEFDMKDPSYRSFEAEPHEDERDPRAYVINYPLPSPHSDADSRYTSGSKQSSGHHSQTSRRSDSQQSLMGKFMTIHPSMVAGKNASRVRFYARMVVRCPCVLTCVYCIGIILLVVLLWRPKWGPPVMEPDFKTFVSADGDAMRQRVTLQSAMENITEIQPASAEIQSARRLGSGFAAGRKLQGNGSTNPNAVPLFSGKSVILVYVAKEKDVLQESVLKEISSFEQKLMAQQGWVEQCKVSLDFAQWQCNMGLSFATLAVPTILNSTKGPFNLQFDGRGAEVLSLNAVLAMLESLLVDPFYSSYLDPARFFPKDFSNALLDHRIAGGTMTSFVQNQRPAMLRSKFTFGLFYGWDDEPRAETKKRKTELKNNYEKWITEEFLNYMEEAAKDLKTCNVYFDGSNIETIQIEQAVNKDILLALGSILFVTLYMYYNIRSMIVTFGCFSIIFASVPVAYVLTPMEKLTIASFMSLFLITVIDIDVIFVFIEFWDQSEYLQKWESRITYVILQAGKSCLATSLTTALSFFANLASVLQPLREFGLFIGLSVMAVYFFAVMFLPPLLILRERRRTRMQTKIREEILRKNPENFNEELERKLGLPCCLPPCCYSKKKDPMEMFVTKVLMKLIHFTKRWAWSVLIFTMLCFPFFLFFIYMYLDIDLGVPEVFPEDHNSPIYKKLAKDFSNLADILIGQEPLEISSACSVSNIHKGSAATPPCAFYWCEVEPTTPVPPPTNTSISCHRSRVVIDGETSLLWNVHQACNFITVESAIAMEEMNESFRGVWAEMVKSMVGQVIAPISATNFPAQVGNLNAMEPLIMEYWEQGLTFERKLFGNSLRVQNNLAASATASNNCRVVTMCHDTAMTCTFNDDDWREMNVSAAVQNYQFGRRLSETTHGADAADDATSPRILNDEDLIPFGVIPKYPASKRFNVVVVWGLRAPRRSPLVGAPSETWGYDPTFVPDNPWSQRAIKVMCDMAMDRPELSVLYSDCWVYEFQQWLVENNRRFPSRDFDKDLLDWARGGSDTTRNLWVIDGKMKACLVKFFVDENRNMLAQKGLDYKAHWDKYVDERNSEASEASRFAYHSTSVWVRSEAQSAILGSTIDTVVIECGLSWLGITIFTGDPLIASLVLLIVLINISGLLFVMTVLLGWSLGPIEIVFIIVFLGYSVTYGLHLANNFSAVSKQDDDLRMLENHYHSRHLWSKKPLRCCSKKAEPDLDSDPDQPPDQSEGSDWQLSSTRSLNETDYVFTSEDVHQLSEPAFRFMRARIAVHKVGPAIMQSTVSTVCSSIFLLLCSMNVFNRLGFVIITVVGLSILMTLIALPAVLMKCGPNYDPCYKRKPRRCFKWLIGCPEQTKEASQPNSRGDDSDEDDSDFPPFLSEGSHAGVRSSEEGLLE
jgi:predicted RND superfamily exporter protein